MSSDADALHRAFLTELEALQKHRVGYLTHFPSTPLDLDDPDVHRLIEALAFFSARTRELARRSVVDVSVRLFRQHFEQLLDPIPASVRVEAIPRRGFADLVHVPRGTALHLTRPGDPALGTKPLELFFQTTSAITVLPLRIAQVTAFPSSDDRGLRIAIAIESPHGRNDVLERLRLDVDHLGDFHASSLLRYALRRNLERVTIVYDEEPRRDAVGAPAQVDFGAREPTLEDLRLHDTPLHPLRSFLQNPWTELAMTFRLPPPPRNWRAFTLYLDVGARWPNELVLRRDSFRLNTVAAVNLRRENASLIEHDGTRDRRRLQHPDPRAGYVPCSILGAYRFTKEGLSPLRSATISPGSGSYDVHHEGRGDLRRLWVELDVPEAIAKPEKISVDVLWHQPVFRDVGVVGFEAHLADRFLSNVDWRCVGEVSHEAEPIPTIDAEKLLRLVALKSQRILGLEDVRFLLDVLGVGHDRHFAGIRDALAGVEARNVPYGRSAGGLKWTYVLTFRNLDVVALPRLDMLAPHLLEMLEAWSQEEVVELDVCVPEYELLTHYVSPHLRS